MSSELPPSLATKEQLEDLFDEVVVSVVLKDLETHPESSTLPPELCVWLKQLMAYTMRGGKLNRGVFLVQTVQMVTWAKEKRELSPDEFKRAAALAWCVEALQASFLVADDIMDQSITRRGLPCWYRTQSPISDDKEDLVGFSGINDALLLESKIYIILEHFFAEDPAVHLQLIKLFHRTSYQTELGQLLDMTSQPKKNSMDLDRFNMDVYKAIVLYKTSFYSFYLPVAVGLIIAGLSSKEVLQEAQTFLLALGEYFQIQDDFLDCYGAPEVIGKIGRDIEERKCSWMMVQAVKASSDEQKQILQKHYGVDNPADVKIVKELFGSLGLKEKFAQYEEESFEKLKGILEATSLVPKVLYNALLQKIYKRQL